jgi:UrcA family protein
MSDKLTSLLAACAVTALGLAIAAPAVAAPSPVVVTGRVIDNIPIRYVSYRDLNLAQDEGQLTLVSRVKYAVKDVCAESMAGDTFLRVAMSDCRGESWQRAEPQINRAVQRARDIAANGWSSIAPVAITISVQ